MLKRAIKILWIVLEELDLMWTVVGNWRFIDRHCLGDPEKAKKAMEIVAGQGKAKK